MSLQNDLKRIQEKINQLKEHPKKEHLFGAGLHRTLFAMPSNVKIGHEYAFNKPIELTEINNIEKEWGIQLPEDYKLFITTIGNGGMGPYYGLFPLNEAQQKNPLKDTICLAHEGCGYYQHLGIRGDKKGKIYVDLEAAGGGVHQLHVSSFFDWYETWLDHSIQTLNQLLYNSI